MKTVLAVLCLAVFAATLKADETLDAILARMEKAAPTFHALSAKVDMVEYQKVLNDTTTDSGTLKMQRKGKDVRAIVTFPDRVIGFLGDIVQVYFPVTNTYTKYNIGANSNVLNQFLLLGFGSSGRELAQSYNITLKGSENVAGHETSRLVLIPKDPKVKERLSQVVVWIPVDAANPVQQQFYEPSGNWRKATYSDIVLNPPIEGTLEMKLPKGAKSQG